MQTIDLLRHGDTGQRGFRGQLDDALSEAGSFVVDLLPGPEATEEAAHIVRTLANIGGEGAWERIAEWIDRLGGAS